MSPRASFGTLPTSLWGKHPYLSPFPLLLIGCKQKSVVSVREKKKQAKPTVATLYTQLPPLPVLSSLHLHCAAVSRADLPMGRIPEDNVLFIYAAPMPEEVPHIEAKFSGWQLTNAWTQPCSHSCCPSRGQIMDKVMAIYSMPKKIKVRK